MEEAGRGQNWGEGGEDQAREEAETAASATICYASCLAGQPNSTQFLNSIAGADPGRPIAIDCSLLRVKEQMLPYSMFPNVLGKYG